MDRESFKDNLILSLLFLGISTSQVGLLSITNSFAETSKVGIEKNLITKQNLVGINQYAITTNGDGCKILNKYHYLSSDGLLYNTSSNILPPRNIEDYCRK